MSKTTGIQPAKRTGDLVLQDVWRPKDTLSAQYGYDLDKLFAETRQHEESVRPPSGKPSYQAPEGVKKPLHPMTGDVVLQEIWRVKDSLSASYGHDVYRLFAGARKRQKQSGHRVVNLQTKRRKG